MVSTTEWEEICRLYSFRCAYCGFGPETLTRDHFVPLSKGGEDVPENVVPACPRCNSSKGDQDFDTWHAQTMAGVGTAPARRNRGRWTEADYRANGYRALKLRLPEFALNELERRAKASGIGRTACIVELLMGAQ